MNSGAGRAGTGQGNGPPPARIKYQRHSAEDWLQRNLARWQARAGRRREIAKLLKTLAELQGYKDAEFEMAELQENE